MKRYSWWTSKTVWGAVVTCAGVLADPNVFALLPAQAAAVVKVVGTVVAVVGARSAIAKNGEGQ